MLFINFDKKVTNVTILTNINQNTSCFYKNNTN